MLKSVILLFLAVVSLTPFSQLNSKTKETEKGTYVYAYHKNGELSTEQFHPAGNNYGEQGYAKAYNYKGIEIYSKPTSRSAMLSSVHFSYHANGAIKCAEYSSHPDAGIQWYRSFTYFDEYGVQTGFSEMSHDMHTTITVPDTSYRHYVELNKLEQLKKEKAIHDKIEQEKTDSLLFFISDSISINLDTTIIYLAEPINNLRRKQTLVKNKIIIEEIVFYKPINGLVKIERKYFKNGVCAKEKTYYHNQCHEKTWNKRGLLISEKFDCT